MQYQAGSNIQAAQEDPNGPPGVGRGGVSDAPRVNALAMAEYNGGGPTPYPQNQSTPDPLAEAFYGVGPEG